MLESSGRHINKLITEKQQLMNQREYLHRDNMNKGQILNSLNSPAALIHSKMIAPGSISPIKSPVTY